MKGPATDGEILMLVDKYRDQINESEVCLEYDRQIAAILSRGKYCGVDVDEQSADG